MYIYMYICMYICKYIYIIYNIMFVCLYNDQYLINLINAWCLDSGVTQKVKVFLSKFSSPIIKTVTVLKLVLLLLLLLLISNINLVVVIDSITSHLIDQQYLLMRLVNCNENSCFSCSETKRGFLYLKWLLYFR